MYQITVESINKFNRVEWKEVVTANSQAAATRKANQIVKECFAEKVNKFQNEFDETIQVWQLV